MATWTHENMLAAARAIRPLLSSLVEDSQRVDQIISILLERETKGEDIRGDLVDALTSTETLREWTLKFLDSQYPPKIAHTRLGIELTSLSGPVAVERYSCPRGDFDWFRFAPDDRVPECPTHHTPLRMAHKKKG